MKLTGKTAIVTGAASGMGKAIAELFAQEGANVIVADINADAINVVVEEIKAAGGQATGSVTNVADEDATKAMIQLATTTYGSLDVLVNNAGILDNFTPAGELSTEVWNRMLAVNLTGPFIASREAINIMEQQENGGVIINNASVGGLFGARGGAAYIATKHGLVGLTKNIAATYGMFGKVRCNAIAPGGVETNIQKTITAPSPLGLKALGGVGNAPVAKPQQIAEVALFLASDSSSFVNGDVIKADGGWTVG